MLRDSDPDPVNEPRGTVYVWPASVKVADRPFGAPAGRCFNSASTWGRPAATDCSTARPASLGTEPAVCPPLERAEEERPSTGHWTADGPAHLILHTVGRLGSAGPLVEIAARVQVVVVVEPERGSAEVVRAVLGDDIHHRARRAAVLRRKLVGDQPDLLDDVSVVNRLLATGDAGIVAVLTIDHDVVRPQPRAVRREVRFRRAGREAGLPAGQLADTRRRSRQREDVPTPHYRELGHALGVEADSNFGVGGIEQRRIRVDLDQFGQRRGSDLHFDNGYLVHGKRDPRSHIACEPGELDGQLVVADRHVEETIAAVRAGDDRPAHIRVDVPHRHRGTRDGQPLIVRDDSFNTSRRRLSCRKTRARENHEQEQRQQTLDRRPHSFLRVKL